MDVGSWSEHFNALDEAIGNKDQLECVRPAKELSGFDAIA
jgi:hypothetical protein